MVSVTPTSLVVTMSTGVWLTSNVSNSLCKKPVAKSMREETILMAVILSFAATALIVPFCIWSLMIVPGAEGSIVLSKRTGTPA